MKRIGNFTQKETELLDILEENDIDVDLCETCLCAFSTDESMQSAIDWLKENPNFNNVDVSKIIGIFGIESEDFSLTIEFEDDDED